MGSQGTVLFLGLSKQQEPSAISREHRERSHRALGQRPERCPSQLALLLRMHPTIHNPSRGRVTALLGVTERLCTAQKSAGSRKHTALLQAAFPQQTSPEAQLPRALTCFQIWVHFRH